MSLPTSLTPLPSQLFHTDTTHLGRVPSVETKTVFDQTRFWIRQFNALDLQMFQIRVQKSTETGFGLVHKTAESETGFGGFLTVKPFRFRQIEQALRLSCHLKQFHVHNHGQLSLTPAESGIYYYYYFFFIL